MLSAAGAPTGTHAQLTGCRRRPLGVAARAAAHQGPRRRCNCVPNIRGAVPAGIVAVMAKGFDSPGASVIGATHENGSAPGAGTHPSGGTIAVIGAGMAAPAPMNMAVAELHVAAERLSARYW